MQGARPHPAFGAEPGVPRGGAGCAPHPDGKQQLSEGCSPCAHIPRGSGCPPATGSPQQAQEQLNTDPGTCALGSPGSVWAPGTPSPNAPPLHRPGAGVSLRHSTLRGARAGACLHPEHLGEPPALSRGTRAPTRQPHGMHRGTSCALGATPRGTTRPPFLGAEGSTRSRPSSTQGSRMPALPCPQAAFSLPLSPERIRAQSRMGPKNSSTSSGWDSALQRVLELSTAPLGLPRASGA